MYVVLVLIDYLIGSSWWRDDWSSWMTTRERRDDLASSKKMMGEARLPTKATFVTPHGLSALDSGVSSYHIIKLDET